MLSLQVCLLLINTRGQRQCYRHCRFFLTFTTLIPDPKADSQYFGSRTVPFERGNLRDIAACGHEGDGQPNT